MPASEQFDLNVIPNGIVPVCHVSQYDESREITIKLFYGDAPYVILGGTEAVIAVRKEDGHIVTVAATYTASQSTVTFKTTRQMCAVAGKNICELQLIQRDGQTILEKLGSLNFIMMVEKDPIDGGLTSESEIHDLEQQIADITSQQMGNYYTKAESDARYLTTADVYTKSQIDDVVNEINYNKADKSDVYTKTQVDSLLNAKEDSSDVDAKLLNKADLEQILISDGYINATSESYPVVTDTYQVKTYTDGSSVTIRSSASTSSSNVGVVEDGTIINVDEIVQGESVNGITSWVHITSGQSTHVHEGYINMYYTAPFYKCEFSYKVNNIKPEQLLIKVKPYQMGAGTASPTNERLIKQWEYVYIIANDAPFNLELPMIMLSGQIEIGSEYGSATNDHSLIDLGDLTWSRVGSGNTGAVIAVPGDAKAPASSTDVADIICTKLDPDSEAHVWGEITDNTIAIDFAGAIMVYSSSLDDMTTAQVKTALTGIKALYESTDPMTTTFTGAGKETLYNKFKTIVGTNSILANCGQILNCKVKNAKVPADIVILTGTLEAGETTLELQNAALTDDSIIDLYTNAYGVNPTDVTVTTGSITLTFDAQESDLGVKVVIK